jgi:hypothetical protein
MKRALLLFLLANPIFAMAVYSNWCQQGNQTISIVGLTSSTTTPVQRSYPGCTITVFQSDGMTLASIYSDNMMTVKANPFTLSGSNGLYSFYAAQGNYVIRTVNTGLSTFTFTIFMPFDGTAGGFITSLNGLTATTQTFAVGTSGTDFTIVSSGSVHTFNIPSASASNRGLLLAADWSTFNGKQGALTFTAPLVNTSGTVALSLPLTIAQGGTGQGTQVLAFNVLSPLTTSGDTLYFNGVNNVRLPIGTNLYCYISNGTAPTWAVCPGTTPGATSGAVQVNLAGAFGGDTTNFNWNNSGKILTVKYLATVGPCASAASPAVCGASASGFVVVAASATTVVVNTTAVTANSQILLTEDQSLGTALSVTCNTQALTTLGPPRVSARAAATSFTIKIDVGPTTNPMCVSYTILN